MTDDDVHQCPADEFGGGGTPCTWHGPDGWGLLGLLGRLTTDFANREIYADIAYCPRCGERLPAGERPDGQNLAEAVRVEAHRLQKAIRKAEKAGLSVELRIGEGQTLGEGAGPVIEVRILDPL